MKAKVLIVLLVSLFSVSLSIAAPSASVTGAGALPIPVVTDFEAGMAALASPLPVANRMLERTILAESPNAHLLDIESASCQIVICYGHDDCRFNGTCNTCYSGICIRNDMF